MNEVPVPNPTLGMLLPVFNFILETTILRQVGSEIIIYFTGIATKEETLLTIKTLKTK